MIRWTCGAALLALLCGCQKAPPPLTPVEGVVTLRGKPLPNAEIMFIPMVPGFDARILSTAITDDQGRYRMMCGNQVGACVCEHRVTVAEGPIPEQFRGMSAAAQVGAGRYLAGLKNRPIPPQYGNFAQTPLTVTVTANQKEYPIELTR